MESNEHKLFFKELLNDYQTLIREQNKIKYEFLALYNILIDLEFTKHKKILKDDNETYVRGYEFQRNLRQSIYVDIEDDFHKYYMVRKLDDICLFVSGSKIEDNYINVFEKLKKQRKPSNNGSNSDEDDESGLSKSVEDPDKISMLQITEYQVYGTNKKIDNYNRERFNIVIDKTKPNIELTNHKFYLDENYITIHMKEDNELLHQYIGYYLYKHIDDLYIHAKGNNLRQFDLSEIKNIKINVPLNENHIMKSVKDCELLYNDIYSLENDINENNKRIDLWTTLDLDNISSNEILRLKAENKKVIEDNKLNRKNIKKFKIIVYNEMLQDPLGEPILNNNN